MLGALIAWTIAGAGMLMLAFVFQNLAIRKPDLDSGVFIYAKAGFGDYAGFNSAIGFWASSMRRQHLLLGVHRRRPSARSSTASATATRSSRSLLATVGVWIFHDLIARGVRDAAVINRIVTVFKIIPILVFIVVLFVYFDAGVFADNWTAYGYGDLGSLDEQIRNTMLITTFVFIGIEGASVYSRYAERREDVGRATVLGLPQRAVDLRAGHAVQLRAWCRSPSSPRPGSRRWSVSSSPWSASGARSSSASPSSCRCSAPTSRGR